MPDPITLPNVIISATYDLEPGLCSTEPLAASPAAAPASAPPGVEKGATLDAGAQQLVDAYASSRGSAAGAAQERNCDLEALKAAVVCGQAVTTVLVSAPTVVGSVLSGFFGGLACGLAGAEAYDCYSKQP